MNKEALGSGVGAAAVSLASTAVPTVVSALQQTIPLCSGVCGACSGGCVAAVCTVAWIGAAAWYHRHKKGEHGHE